MCGIFGCVLHDGSQAAPLIHAALKRLEYRGYDSVGEVTIDGDKLTVKKDSGRLEEVHAKYDLDDLPGPVGVGHTRWATHGRPVYENSHPLVDCKSRIAVVHNGIIQNYLDIKRELESKGHHFQSRTDTEVVPHLVEDYLTQGMSLEEAFRKTVNRLEGAYAIVLTSTEQPKTILCARQESPLVLGIGEGEYYCGSDFAAFLPLTRKAVLLDEGEMAVLNPNGARILKLKNAAPVKRDPITITWDPESAKKQGFKHFMLKEIHEQAQSLRDARAKGATILSVLNVLGSTLMRLSTVYIDQNAGPEIGVASTKAFTSQIAVLLRLASTVGRRKGEVSAKEITELEAELHRVPALIQTILNTKIDEIRRIAEECDAASSICFLGRGVNVPTALEGRLKLLELSYVPAIAYPAGESKHGFIALIEEGFPVIFVAPKDETHKRIIGNIMEMKARGARVISIIEEGDEEIRNLSDRVVEIGESLPSLVTPLIYVVPLQLLAYYLSVFKGHDPDYPRNLAKSVTVE